MPPPGTLEEPRAPGLPRGQARPPEESAPFPLWSSVAWRSRGGARACDCSVLERRSGQGNSVAKVGGGAADGGGAASCPRFSWWGTVGPSSGLSVVLSSDVFLPSASAHPISKLLRSFLREASLGFSDRGGSPAPACSAHLCRDASVCWFICVAPPPLTLTHTH